MEDSSTFVSTFVTRGLHLASRFITRLNCHVCGRTRVELVAVVVVVMVVVMVRVRCSCPC
jgi:hypothetical protein